MSFFKRKQRQTKKNLNQIRSNHFPSQNYLDELVERLKLKRNLLKQPGWITYVRYVRMDIDR